MDISTVDELEAHRSCVANFIRFGGMPGLLSLRDKSVLSFNKMISWLALNNGGQLNKSTLSNVVGISSRQIERYLEVLQGTFGHNDARLKII